MVVEINDLPDEVLEFILSYLPPYKDLDECQLVCKRWNSIVKNVMRRSVMNLYKGLSDFRLCWKTNTNVTASSSSSLAISIGNNGTSPPIIAGRFSHAAVVHENSMYIFGGGSSTNTTFNDLWRFDLSKREWIRPLSMGSYPSPKGSATMVCYNNQLVLFGGWRYPSLHPLYQPWCLFDELHLYDIKNNRWIVLTQINGPPPMAGHSATVHRNKMIVFGGYQINNEINSNSNDIWCLDLDTFVWRKPEISNLKPPPRYGQFQISLNDTNLLIVGGCGGPNNMFSDAWLLDMSSDVWQWTNIPIRNKKWAATHMWCNPACRVGNKLVVLGPTPNLPGDFQILRQQRPGIMMNRLNQQQNYHRLPILNDDELILIYDEILQPRRNYIINNNNNRHNFNNNNNMNNNNNRNNGNRNNNNSGLLDRNQQNIDGGSVAVGSRHQQQRNEHQQNNRNHVIEDEAANRLQRNLALRCREDDVKLPKRFDEPFEDRFRMAAFNVHHSKSRNSSRERQLERVRRMEERMNTLRYFRQNNNNDNGSNSSSSSSSSSSSRSNSTSNNENYQNPLNGGARENRNNEQRQEEIVDMNSGNINTASTSGANATISVASAANMNVNCNSTRNNANNINNKKQEEPSPKRTKRNCLGMFVCDISNVLSDDPYIEWIEYKNNGIISGAPERLILSTIVAGNGELIMFGGVHKESLSEMTHKVSNSVHFLTAPKQII